MKLGDMEIDDATFERLMEPVMKAIAQRVARLWVDEVLETLEDDSILAAEVIVDT